MKPVQWLGLILALSVGACLIFSWGGMTNDENTALEQRVENVLQKIQGVGEVRVMIYTEKASDNRSGDSNLPAGAIVVAQGAGDMRVMLQLRCAVQTLLALPNEKIEVYEMGALVD